MESYFCANYKQIFFSVTTDTGHLSPGRYDYPGPGKEWLFNCACASASADRDGRPFYLGDPAVDDIGRAAAAVVRIDINCRNRAVPGAGPAFHAGIVIKDLGFFARSPKMRCGQTVTHIPQPTHASRLSLRIAAPSIYLKSFIIMVSLPVSVQGRALTCEWRYDPQDQGQYCAPDLKGQALPHLFCNSGE